MKSAKPVNLEKSLLHEELAEFQKYYISIEDGYKAIDDLSASKSLDKLSTYLEEYKNALRDASRTAKSWLQYLNYIEVIKCFIRAERTVNWNLHLVAVGQLINLFVATGHINYAKSARLYLQLMFDRLSMA